MEVVVTLIVHIAIIIIFILLGVFFRRGKGSFLIAGYNTYSKTEKARYNERALCHFMSKIMFAYAGCFAVVATSEFFHSLIPLWIGLGLFLAVTVFTLIYANTGNRFKK